MKKVTKKKKKKSLLALQETIKRSNLQITGVPEGEEAEKGAKSLSKEITAQSPTNLRRRLNIQVHEAYGFPQIFDPMQSFPRHIIIKLSKIKDK